MKKKQLTEKQVEFDSTNETEEKVEETIENVAEEGATDKYEAQTIALSEYDHKVIDKDMKYRGPLSYRYLRLIGWVAMAIMFISMMIGLAVSIRGATGVPMEDLMGLQNASEILSLFSALPLPLFLIANFAVILQQKGNYKKLLFTYGKILIAIYIGFIIVYYHYIVILLMRLGEMSFLEAREISIEIFTALGKQNGLVVNVFVDLFCCVLIMFFIDYTPKKYFQGNKIILFRLLVLLPIIYEVGSAILMGLLGMNAMFSDFTFSLPPEILPLIGKKPIGMIIAFVLICIYVKIREKRYLKKGGTVEGYEIYLETNRNSFKFSAVASIIFLVVALIDIVLYVVPPILLAMQSAEPENTLIVLLDMFANFTVGKSACLILVIPFTLLFSYTKKHDNEKLDKLMPFIGIGLVVFAALETIFFCVCF